MAIGIECLRHSLFSRVIEAVSKDIFNRKARPAEMPLWNCLYCIPVGRGRKEGAKPARLTPVGRGTLRQYFNI